MTLRSRKTLVWIVALLLTIALPFAHVDRAAPADHWVVTWAAAPQQPAGTSGYRDQTLRMCARASLGGRRARVRLTNAFGTTALVVGAAHLAIHAEDSAILPGSDRELHFGGRPSVRIPPGADVVSDAVDLEIPPLADLAISLYLPNETGPATRHGLALRTTYIAAGDVAGQAELTGAKMATSWFFVSGVDVAAPDAAGAIVAIGDSITDGATSTVDANRSWPSLLAERLQANKSTRHLSVANLGISGNRVLGDGSGASALARFDRDVLGQAGATWLIVLEGINDINGARTSQITAPDLIAALQQLIVRAHTHGIRVAGATLTPSLTGTGDPEAMRVAANTWIRNADVYDAVIDFDAAVRDPAAPTQFLKLFNNTDRLHPNDAGYKAMANAIDLRIFTKR